MISSYFKTFITSIFFLFLTSFCFAQATKLVEDEAALFKKGKALMQNEQYSLALPTFAYVQQHYQPNNGIEKDELTYYLLVCKLLLQDVAAPDEAAHYLTHSVNTARVQMLQYYYAENCFKRKDYSNALLAYNAIKLENLSNKNLIEVKFHKGYILFTQQNFNEAKPLMNSVRQIKNSSYYEDANYYYGFICLYQKNYKEAIATFKIVENNASYQSIVPFYLAQLYYYTNDKAKAISYAEAQLKKGGQYYDLQLKQLLGHLYFEERNFTKALPLLAAYVNKTEKVRREDLYEVSYCYYEAKDWEKAIKGLKELGGKDDSLAQNSMYLLADAYLKVNNKPNARNAFLFCALNSNNPSQQEVSAFNYAKLSYELGYNDIALSDFRTFIKKYPSSLYAKEAKELLFSILSNSNNYLEALELYKVLNVSTETTKRLYAKIAFARAIELLNDQQITAADSLFQVLEKVPYNNNFIPSIQFWRGEIAYRLQQYPNAITYNTQYLQSNYNYEEVNAFNAKYTIAYSFYHQQNYTQALNYFKEIYNTNSSNNKEDDIAIRVADCYYITKQYAKAATIYDKIIANNQLNVDYALYQKALLKGATEQYSQKIDLLQLLVNKYPSSKYVANAYLEMANTYMFIEDYTNALKPLNTLLNNPAYASIQPQVLLNIGLCHFNKDDNNEALNAFTNLVKKHPATSQSDAAIEYIRNIYVEQQQPQAFIQFMQSNGKQVSTNEADSITYTVAFNAFQKQPSSNSINQLINYSLNFPNGKEVLKANYFTANYFNGEKQFDTAMLYYKKVMLFGKSAYSENSLLQLARITYFEKKNYAEAETYFTQLKTDAVASTNKLEAMRGLLRCQYKLGKIGDATPNAQELLQQSNIAIDDKMMATIIIAKSLQSVASYDEAINNYKAVITLGKNEFSAESKYRIAEILLAQNKLPDAEKAAFEVINKVGSYPFWITKSYLLLADVYLQQKDFFNAEATLKSIIENATIEELKKEAADKLAIVLKEKNNNTKVAQPQ